MTKILNSSQYIQDISSKKSSSIILSIVATGDLWLPPTLGMLLVCCLVRANERVLWENI